MSFTQKQLSPSTLGESVPAEVIQEILRTLKDLRFGSLEITVHDDKVVQIERKEKVRFGGKGN